MWGEQAQRESDGIDTQLAAFRNSIPDLTKSSANELTSAITRISVHGTKLASYRGELGRCSRLWGTELQKIADGQYSQYQEVPLMPGNPVERFLYVDFIRDFGSGIVSILAVSASSKLSHAEATVNKQEEEIAALQRHSSDVVGLRQTEINGRLTTRIKRLTEMLVALTSILIGVQIYLYLNPISSNLPAAVVYALMVVAAVAVALGVVIGTRSFLGPS